MFKDLRNEAIISFTIKTNEPLCIKGASDLAGIDPLLSNMACIRTYHKGQMMPFIPGSSLKGVFRSRAEEIIASVCKNKAYNPLDRDKSREYKKTLREKSGEVRYQSSHPSVQLFGEMWLAGRVRFIDALPESMPVMGERKHVGINRVTGAAEGGSLFDIEVVEDGSFKAEIRLENYALWQMQLLLAIIQELDKGFLALGTATSRGCGRVNVRDLKIALRDYRRDANESKWLGYDENDFTTLPDGSKFELCLYYHEALITVSQDSVWHEVCREGSGFCQDLKKANEIMEKEGVMSYAI